MEIPAPQQDKEAALKIALAIISHHTGAPTQMEDQCGFAPSLKACVFFVAENSPLDLIAHLDKFVEESYALKALLVATSANPQVIPLLREKLAGAEGQITPLSKLLRKTLERLDSGSNVDSIRRAFRRAKEKIFPK